MRALNIAATGMAAQQTNVDVISNNIANMNTIGYKRQEANFEDLLYEDVKRPGAQSSETGTIIPTGIQLGAGVSTASVYRITTQGTLTNTGNQLDLAVNGSGYFQVLLPSGETAYTRAGNFSLNNNGVLVTSDGYTVPDHHSSDRDSGHHLRRRPGSGDAAGSGGDIPSGSAPARQLRQPGRLGGHGLQPVHDQRRLRSTGHGKPDGHRIRLDPAGLDGSLKRRFGDGDQQPDHRPARIRDEFQGRHDGRSDAAKHQYDEVVRP
jgi:flagellar basal-body rod protein FlgG